jgi:hypothetical protein
MADGLSLKWFVGRHHADKLGQAAGFLIVCRMAVDEYVTIRQRKNNAWSCFDRRAALD